MKDEEDTVLTTNRGVQFLQRVGIISQRREFRREREAIGLRRFSIRVKEF